MCRCGITERHSPAHSPGPGTLTLAGTPLPDEGATLPRRPLLRLVRVTTSHPTERWVAARQGRDENVSSSSGPPQESPQAQAAGCTPPPRAPAPRGRDRAPCRQQTSRRRTPDGTGRLTRRLAKQGCNLGDYEMPDRKVRTDTPASGGDVTSGPPLRLGGLRVARSEGLGAARGVGPGPTPTRHRHLRSGRRRRVPERSLSLPPRLNTKKNKPPNPPQTLL